MIGNNQQGTMSKLCYSKRKISVLNSSGSIVFETIISGSNGKKKINTSQWAKGMYLFKITYQDKTEIVKKLMISK